MSAVKLFGSRPRSKKETPALEEGEVDPEPTRRTKLFAGGRGSQNPKRQAQQSEYDHDEFENQPKRGRTVEGGNRLFKKTPHRRDVTQQHDDFEPPSSYPETQQRQSHQNHYQNNFQNQDTYRGNDQPRGQRNFANRGRQGSWKPRWNNDNDNAQNGRFNDNAQNGRFNDNAQNGRFNDNAQNGRFNDNAQNGRFNDNAQNGRFKDNAQNGRFNDNAQNGRFNDNAQNSRFNDEGRLNKKRWHNNDKTENTWNRPNRTDNWNNQAQGGTSRYDYRQQDQSQSYNRQPAQASYQQQPSPEEPPRRKSRFNQEAPDQSHLPLEQQLMPDGSGQTLEDAANAVHVQLKVFKIRIGQLQEVVDKADRSKRSRSPSPMAFAEAQHAARAQETLEHERDQTIVKAMDSNKLFRPPTDWVPRNRRLTEKFFLPVEEYPNINFIGLIIGPRGNTLKRMEQELNCKVSIRGRGATKDGRKNQTDEEARMPLHCIITADGNDGVARVKDRILRLVAAVPDDREMHKRTQLRELASLNGNPIDGFNKEQEKFNLLSNKPTFGLEARQNDDYNDFVTNLDSVLTEEEKSKLSAQKVANLNNKEEWGLDEYALPNPGQAPKPPPWARTPQSEALAKQNAATLSSSTFMATASNLAQQIAADPATLAEATQLAQQQYMTGSGYPSEAQLTAYSAPQLPVSREPPPPPGV